ncbi:unnamed protein product [Mucor hiemalis]
MTDKFIEGKKKFREYMVAKRKERLSNIEVEISDFEEEDQNPPLPEARKGSGDPSSETAIKAENKKEDDQEVLENELST